MPKEGDALTQEQINAAVNIGSFRGAKPEKNWHTGLFEPWTLGFGYSEGKALYGGTLVGETRVHIYYLADRDGYILLNPGETPDKYGVKKK